MWRSNDYFAFCLERWNKIYFSTISWPKSPKTISSLMPHWLNSFLSIPSCLKFPNYKLNWAAPSCIMRKIFNENDKRESAELEKNQERLSRSYQTFTFTNFSALNWDNEILCSYLSHSNQHFSKNGEYLTWWVSWMPHVYVEWSITNIQWMKAKKILKINILYNFELSPSIHVFFYKKLVYKKRVLDW